MFFFIVHFSRKSWLFFFVQLRTNFGELVLHRQTSVRGKKHTWNKLRTRSVDSAMFQMKKWSVRFRYGSVGSWFLLKFHILRKIYFLGNFEKKNHWLVSEPYTSLFHLKHSAIDPPPPQLIPGMFFIANGCLTAENELSEVGEISGIWEIEKKNYQNRWF